MKKLLIATAALAMVAGTVQAQSSVTISGRIDQSYGSHDVGTTGQGNVAKVNSNVYATSRITISGVEDLGGGLSAGLFLETGLGPDVGTAGTVTGSSGGTYAASASGTNNFFSREANMFIRDAKLGELRIGKITTQATDADVYVNATASHVAGANQALVGKFAGVAEDGLSDNANNAVAYTSPVFSGAQVQLFRAEGESATGYDQGSTTGGSVRYQAGKLKATYAVQSNKVTSGKIKDQTSYGLTYDFGMVRVGGVQVVNDNSENTANDKAKTTVYSVAAPLNAKVTLVGALHDYSSNLGSAYDGKAYMIGATYDFSKRTATYVTYASSKNEASGKYGISGMTGTTAGADEKLTSVGIKHFF
jgi:predicted porin